MIDVSAKPRRLRTARAEGRLLCTAETLDRIETNQLPKGDLFHTARAAALLAVKRTPDLIPHCHPVAIEGTVVEFRNERAADGSGIVIASVEVKSIGRTGPEMEAVTAVSVALCVAYDLLKAIDTTLRIADIALVAKTGGKSDPTLRVREGMTAALITWSEAVESGRKAGGAADAVAERLTTAGLSVSSSDVVSGDGDRMIALLNEILSRNPDFIFTLGGTGSSPGDAVPELLRKHADRELPGIGERMRAHGAERTPLALFTTPLAVVWKETLVVALPGSRSGAMESLDAVLPGLFQARRMIRR